ncbi:MULTISPECIES: LytR/AlgR family response regulator transcription factor [Sphingobacterium]|jgi:DNA-binding LytR/AlgR family response regulator|uniref:LytR/AlgR family response regulator transcription factor n=1 Tax=Sphingobacterium TaxID=28453 RepID=UPI00200F7EB0|nr:MULTISPECIES: LytTR family DNA-binding domain-containing protein [Sphingobacterium]UPZ35598.1 LytTR family DNA-binding domain-containing protein [Sphingobacterium sp. PCS056]WGQ14819.1 LytTR family DNA-binding domain-containing protein [Sphingobacterium faecium]
MMDIKCAIVDDEPFARKGIAAYIDKISFLKLTAECEDAIELSEYLSTEHVDLIFLDIEMPELSGLDFIATLSSPPKIIIVSAYEKYALRGYELEVVDYLLKPVPFGRFLKAAHRAHEIITTAHAHSLNISKKAQEEHIFIKVDKKLKKVMLQDILFIQSMGNYVIVHTLHSQDITYCTLQQMFSLLPKHPFISCHRSYIVNMNNISAIEGNQIQVGSYKIPIARNLKDEVMTLILRHQ